MSSLAVVAGPLAAKPGNGGAAWTRLSWILGLRAVGFDVHLVEQLDGTPAEGALRWWGEVTGAFDLPATLVGPDGETLRGLDPGSLQERCAASALLLNISGNLRDPALRDRVATRVYVDLDPGYTQLWAHEALIDLGGHDHHVTVGLAVSSDTWDLPDGGVRWLPTLQPVLLDHWTRQPLPPSPRFTTVGAWRGPFGTLEQAGRRLGPKAHELRRLLDLPKFVDAPIELTLDIDDTDAADRRALVAAGWRLVDPREVAGTPAAFRDYVQGSAAELSVAQGMYVASGSGWFADRSTRYLATGRPVVVQDTGFSSHLPVGEGILTFTDTRGAVAAAEELLGDLDRHAKAARGLAEELFAAEVVLGRLCEEVGIAP